MREILKYLPVLVKYAKYLKFLPLLFTVVSFVKEAERKFREANSGAKKLAWASEQFGSLVDLLESSSVIPEKLARALRDGADKIITVIVQIMNATGGVDPDAGEGGGDREEIYGIAFPMPIPSNDDLFAQGFVPTDLVYWNDDQTDYLVMKRGQKQPSGYKLARRLDGK